VGSAIRALSHAADLGPSTARDAPGRLVDRFVSPTTYVNNTGVQVGYFVMKGVSTRAGLLDTDPVIDSAYDPYAFVRNAWLQRREYQVHGGSAPEAVLPEEDRGGSRPRTTAGGRYPEESDIK